MAEPKAKMRAPISKASHDSLITYIQSILAKQKQEVSLRAKLETIDQAYYGYKLAEAGDVEGLRKLKEDIPLLEIPLAMSQVDSVTAYLVDIFASGYPLIGVVGSKDSLEVASKFEALLSEHAKRAQWVPNIVSNIFNAVKYNFCAMEVTWEQVQSYSLQESTTVGSSDPILANTWEGVNTLKNLDPYNLIWDSRFLPNEATTKGDFVGYAEILSKHGVQLLLAKLSQDGTTMNGSKALESNSSAAIKEWYTERPQISEYTTKDTYSLGTDWDNWLAGGTGQRTSSTKKHYSSAYLVHTLYLRIVPAEFGLVSPQANLPQLRKVVIVNGEHIIHICKVNEVDGRSGIIIGALKEDGYGLQTPSITEATLPSQDAASDLLNIRISASRRALGDRLIYDDAYIAPEDINSAAPAPKIPLMKSLNGDVGFGDIVKHIPFDASGTAGAMNDIQNVIQLAEMSHGVNSQMQGMFRKGNRTLGEVQDVMGASNMRSMMLALSYEFRVMAPVKAALKLNTLLKATKQQIMNPNEQVILDIDPTEFRATMLDFKLADGLINKSKILPPEVFATLIQFFMQSEQLVQEYDVPAMTLQLASIQGVPDLSGYKRSTPPSENPQPAQEAGSPARTQTKQEGEQ